MKAGSKEREALIAAASAAFRAVAADGRPIASSAWRDLDAAGRAEAFELTRGLRRLEAALDPAGLSSTGRAVLNRIRRG